MYHVSGATAFTRECPHGIAGERMCQVSFDEIVDVQLVLYETMLAHAIDRKTGS